MAARRVTPRAKRALVISVGKRSITLRVSPDEEARLRAYVAKRTPPRRRARR